MDDTQRAALHRLVDSVSKEAARFVRPLFIDDPEKQMRHIGSCVFVEVGGQPLALSASHVFCDAIDHRLYTVVGNKLYPLGGTRYRTDLETDLGRADLAIMCLPPNIRRDFRNGFLGVADLVLAPVSEWAVLGHDWVYVAVGFPHSRVRLRFGTDSADLGRYAHATFELPPSSATSVGLRPETHLAVAFAREKTHRLDGPNRAPDPHGMSGGALLSVRPGAKQFTYMLAGVLTEVHPAPAESMIASRPALFVEALRALRPTLSPLLPSTHGLSLTVRTAQMSGSDA